MTHSRVNITLDLETHGARRKKELPLKLLVLGNFSHNQNTKSLSHRERININNHNFDDVLSSITPQLVLPDGTMLQFKKLNDFQPTQLVKQIPRLQKLMSMRNLLKELKSNLIDNSEFRKTLEKLANNKSQFNQLRDELHHKAPLLQEKQYYSKTPATPQQ